MEGQHCTHMCVCLKKKEKDVGLWGRKVFFFF